jgi:hypothetical protein
MPGTPSPSAPDDDPRLPSPEQLDAAARELTSDRLPKQVPLPRKAAGVPSIEELDAAADELRSGRLPIQNSEDRPKPKPKGGLHGKPPPPAPLIEALDAGAAELHSDRLPAQPEPSEEQPPLS